MLSVTTKDNGAAVVNIDQYGQPNGQVYGYSIDPEDIIKIIDNHELNEISKVEGHFSAAEGYSQKLFNDILHEHKWAKDAGISLYVKPTEGEEYPFHFVIGIMYDISGNLESIFNCFSFDMNVHETPRQ